MVNTGAKVPPSHQDVKGRVGTGTRSIHILRQTKREDEKKDNVLAGSARLAIRKPELGDIPEHTDLNGHAATGLEPGLA